MHCPSCGYPIEQQNMERCPRCGYALTPTGASGGQGDLLPPGYRGSPLSGGNSGAAGSTGGYVPPQPENPYGGYGNAAPPPGYGPPQQDPPSPYGQYGQGQYGQPAPPSGYGQPAPPSGYGQQPYGQPAPPSGYGRPAYGQPAPPSGYGQPAPPSGYGQPTYGQPAPPSYPMAPGYPQPGQPPFAPLPERKSHTGLIVTIVSIVVVVLAACVGGTLWAAHTLGQTTISGAPTSTVSETPASSPTATVIYGATFASDATGWSQDAGHCFLGTGGYHAAHGYTCFAPIGQQADVDISVKAQQVSGPTTWGYGIVLRHQGPGNTYAFMIDSNGKWVFAKCAGSNCDNLVDFTANDAIKGGLNTVNTLEVKAVTSHFDFFVNGTKVGSFDDSTFGSGELGVVASGEDIECVFTDFLVSRPS